VKIKSLSKILRKKMCFPNTSHFQIHIFILYFLLVLFKLNKMIFVDISPQVMLSLFSEWLSLKSVCQLNSAFCNKEHRQCVLSVLSIRHSIQIHSDQSIGKMYNSVANLTLTSQYDRKNYPKVSTVFKIVSTRNIDRSEVYNYLEASHNSDQLSAVNCLNSKTSAQQLQLPVLVNRRFSGFQGFHFCLWSTDMHNSSYSICRYLKFHNNMYHHYALGSTTNGVFYAENFSHHLSGNGDWCNGWRTDDVVVNYQNGDQYTGRLQTNIRHGEGVMKSHHDGSVYIGAWYDGLMSGFGRMTFQSGDVLEGQWRANRFTALEGKLVLSNGDQYIGSFICGCLVRGHGIVRYANGDLFKGYLQQLDSSLDSCDVDKCYCESEAHSGNWFGKLESMVGTRSFANGDERVIGSWTVPSRDNEHRTWIPSKLISN
jgi:hypothetical protein